VEESPEDRARIGGIFHYKGEKLEEEEEEEEEKEEEEASRRFRA